MKEVSNIKYTWVGMETRPRGNRVSRGQEHYFFPETTFPCTPLPWSQRVTFSRPKEGPRPGYPPSDHAPWIPTGPQVLFGPGVASWGGGFSTLSPYWSPLPPPGHCPGLQVSWAGFPSWLPPGRGASRCPSYFPSARAVRVSVGPGGPARSAWSLGSPRALGPRRGGRSSPLWSAAPAAHLVSRQGEPGLWG